MSHLTDLPSGPVHPAQPAGTDPDLDAGSGAGSGSGDTRADPPRPAPPPPRRRRFNAGKWRARAVVLLMLAGAAVGGQRLAQSRSAALTEYKLGTVILTARPIPVEADRTGQITAVDVRAQQHVHAGQQLATLQVSEATTQGKLVHRPLRLNAPKDGIVGDDPAPVGTLLTAGQALAHLYDPAELTLDTAIKVSDLPQLSPGMIATLHAGGVPHPIRAVVARVLPQIATPASDGTAPATPDRMELVLVPQRASDVAGLVPGMHFTGTVDTSTGRPDAPNVLNVGG